MADYSTPTIIQLIKLHAAPLNPPHVTVGSKGVTLQVSFAAQPSCRHSLLREQVSVGAAVLHGDAVAFAAHAVPRHGDGAVVIRQRRVLQHRHVPQEGVGTLLRLQAPTHDDITQFVYTCFSFQTLTVKSLLHILF